MFCGKGPFSISQVLFPLDDLLALATQLFRDGHFLLSFGKQRCQIITGVDNVRFCLQPRCSVHLSFGKQLFSLVLCRSNDRLSLFFSVGLRLDCLAPCGSNRLFRLRFGIGNNSLCFLL